jgi:hypothetical protein
VSKREGGKGESRDLLLEGYRNLALSVKILSREVIQPYLHLEETLLEHVGLRCLLDTQVTSKSRAQGRGRNWKQELDIQSSTYVTCSQCGKRGEERLPRKLSQSPRPSGAQQKLGVRSAVCNLRKVTQLHRASVPTCEMGILVPALPISWDCDKD